MTPTENELELSFGTDSTGSTLEERARTSTVSFVRSQVQLAHASEGAKGRVLSASEALRTFGWEVLRVVGQEGAAPLLKTSDEPSRTIRARRMELGLDIPDVARRAHIRSDELVAVETPGARSSIRSLENVAQVLALDERALGFRPNAGQDRQLGVRLRQLTTNGDVAGFTKATVFQLAEAAWVISREDELKRNLGMKATLRLPLADTRFGYPAYQTGYELAQKTRHMLGLDEHEPVVSVRRIIQDEFGIPLVQLEMNNQLAGATLANGSVRGILVNESGANNEVWVRRMTLSHELGHLLWDPEERLERVRVDAYAELEQNERDSRRDSAEIRANAFAISFLAPPEGVLAIDRRTSNQAEAVLQVMSTYGISATAARYHLNNVTGRPVSAQLRVPPIEPDGSWTAGENLGLDFFPLSETPLSRRGRFAEYVVKLFQRGDISDDTAAQYLNTTSSTLKEKQHSILELYK